MITEWLFNLVAPMLTAIGDLFPKEPIPVWFTDLSTNVNGFFAKFDGVGVWINWPVVSSIIGLVLTWWTVGFVIKLARAIAGHIPAFGGNG